MAMWQEDAKDSSENLAMKTYVVAAVADDEYSCRISTITDVPIASVDWCFASRIMDESATVTWEYDLL